MPILVLCLIKQGRDRCACWWTNSPEGLDDGLKKPAPGLTVDWSSSLVFFQQAHQDWNNHFSILGNVPKSFGSRQADISIPVVHCLGERWDGSRRQFPEETKGS